MSDADDTPDAAPPYASPKRCLARSFRLSRDRWKQKANQRRQQVKALKVQVRDLRASRALWKAKALHLEAQLAGPPPDRGAARSRAGQAAPPPDPAPAAPADAPEAARPKKARRARR